MFRLVLIVIACILTFEPAISSLETKTATIRGKLRLPNDQPPNTTLIALNDAEYTTYTKIDGSFVFHNVKPGVHLLDVQSPSYHYSHVKIQLLETDMDAPKCIEYSFAGANKQAIPHPLLLTAHAKYEYFEPRMGFSLMSLLKNPMMLMMVFSAVLMFLMPKMMENLDPEEKERMQRQMEMQSDPSKMLTQLWGDFSGTGSGGGETGGAGKKAGKGGKSTRRVKKE